MTSRTLIILFLSVLVFGVVLIGFLMNRTSDVNVAEARGLVTAGKYSDAFDYYQRYITAYPSDVDAKIEYARLLMEHGMAEAGLNILQVLLDRMPHDSRLAGIAAEIIRSTSQLALRMTDSGSVCFSRKQYDQAGSYYRQALFYSTESARWQRGSSDSLSLITGSQVRDARVNLAFVCSLQGDSVSSDSAITADPETQIGLAVRLCTAAHGAFGRNDFGAARSLYLSANRYLDRCQTFLGSRAGLRSETYYSLALSELNQNLAGDALRNLRIALALAPHGFYLTDDIRAMIARLEHR
jgi:tetratricopeptide (TPR) repeat protein